MREENYDQLEKTRHQRQRDLAAKELEIRSIESVIKRNDMSMVALEVKWELNQIKHNNEQKFTVPSLVELMATENLLSEIKIKQHCFNVETKDFKIFVEELDKVLSQDQKDQLTKISPSYYSYNRLHNSNRAGGLSL